MWTCALRDGVTFHDGATLDANDVVVSFAAAWDTKHPLHIGRDGLFDLRPRQLRRVPQPAARRVVA